MTSNSISTISSKKEWSDPQHVSNYLNSVDSSMSYRKEGESILLSHIPSNVKRVLDIGTGDGRLIKLIKSHLPSIEVVALDISPIMIKAVKDNFSNDSAVKVIEHDLGNQLPDMGYFDAVVSGLAIHHLTHKRKYALYDEIYDILYPGGVFCNLEHVSSPSIGQHARFLKAISYTNKKEDYTNRLLSMEKQLQWLRDIGFVDVDCYWKWLEIALLIGYKI
jgi:tRNA (cmo5U34)-methyltransferase